MFLAYASRYGQALVDRRLYLPESWTKDPARCARASIPEAVEFATKPKMARAMIEAVLNAGAPCAYVLGDAVYGADSSLRRMLEGRHQPYVMAVRGAHAMRRGARVGSSRPLPKSWPAKSRRKIGRATPQAKARRDAPLRLGPGAAALDLREGL